MRRNDEIQCPRCGTFLVRGFTAAHKVCMDCPDCRGRLITLPVLKDGLGAAGVSALSRAAKDGSKAGCRCPSCGNVMGLLKVGIDGRKVEIDVCASCLSVWCDRGEFEALVPVREPEPGKEDFHSLAMKASPEARERLAEAMLEQVPEDVDPRDFTLDEVMLDVVRLVVGAPTLWRKVEPSGPICSMLLSLGIVAFQGVFYHLFNAGEHLIRRGFWAMDAAMIRKIGYAFPGDPLSWLAFPAVQLSGIVALLLVVALFPVFAIVERRDGCARFIGLLIVFWLTSLAAHSFQTATSSAVGSRMCGIVPIAYGFVSYLWSAYPTARMVLHQWSNMPVWSYLIIVSLFLFSIQLVTSLTASFALFAIVDCIAVGSLLGIRTCARRKRQTG